MPEATEHILQAARRGERAAQHELYCMFAPRVFGVCLRYAATREEADDWAQDAWVQVFTKLDQYAGTGEFGAWLRRLTVNCCLQHLRRNRIKIDGAAAAALAEGESALPERMHIAPEVIANMSAAELVTHIDALPVGYRLVFNLVAVEGYSHTEAAEALGISVSTSRSQLTRARTTLQRRLAHVLTFTL